MTVIAIVSKLSDERRARIVEVGEGEIEFLDCSTDRDRLAREGTEVEVVYGNVREFELPALPRLRWIHASWTGVENLLYPALVASDVIVTNTRGQSATAMSEHAIAGLLYMTRDLAVYRRAADAGQWKPAESNPRILAGSVALVLGLGGIGSAIARRLAALDVRVWGVNTSGAERKHCEATTTFDAVRPRLGVVEHVIDCLPLTAATRHICDDAFFQSLRPGATFTNLGRGATVDHTALLRHLETGQLFGAVLDVTDPEPPPPDSPILSHPRILPTAHQSPKPGSGGVLAFDLFLENLGKWRKGDVGGMKCVVDKGAGY